MQFLKQQSFLWLHLPGQVFPKLVVMLMYLVSCVGTDGFGTSSKSYGFGTSSKSYESLVRRHRGPSDD